METMRKIAPIIDLGGINLLLFKIEDKITGGKNAAQYQYKIFENASPEDYPRLLKDQFKIVTGEDLNLNNPQSFNEKIQWLKLNDSTPLKTRLADKYRVREWIAEKIGEKYLIPILGAWESFDDIDFESLPDCFVLKCNHGSGMNMVVKEKSNLDKEMAKMQFNEWMGKNYAFCHGLELHYKDIPRKIIAEEYVEQMDANLLDYKIHVFNGEPKIIQIIGDRDLVNHKAKECFLTPEWIQQELMYHTYDMYDNVPAKPYNLDEMLKIARLLGNDFRYVRVDLYDLNGDIKFGEMTFTPMSGFGRWNGDERFLVGGWIEL